MSATLRAGERWEEGRLLRSHRSTRRSVQHLGAAPSDKRVGRNGAPGASESQANTRVGTQQLWAPSRCPSSQGGYSGYPLPGAMPQSP